jgi:formylglycine-generating enzyme required for sulfatase activity
VAVFARRYPECRVIVTCRTLSYQDPAWQLGNFDSIRLAPFNPEQIDQFIAAWYGELARLGSIPAGSVAGVTIHLRVAVRRPDLWRLASNPLLLTVMALTHTHQGRLPQARALLYEETVDILLWRWEQVKVSGKEDARLQELLTRVDRGYVDLKQALSRLAFEVHQQSGARGSEMVADIGELRLHKSLMELHPDKSWDWAHELVEVMKLRAGLLVERMSEVFAFPHRTFQEYLAGTHLSSQPDFAQQAAQLVVEGAFWREVVLLAVGRLVYLNTDTAKPLALVAELCPLVPADTDMGWRQVWLAGDVLLEMGLNRVRDSVLGRELEERVRQGLTSLLSNGCLRPVERAAAGNTLAAIGDSRFRADAWYLPDEPLLGFVEIPSGPFLMGSDSKRDSEAHRNETPQRLITLAQYWIARYPVTVAQFQAFLEDSGHKPTNAAGEPGPVNHPVVNVSWHDAIAYCRWLTERLRRWEGTPEPLATRLRQEGWRVTLPSEAEWEKAARGLEGRIYPWDNKFDPARANTEDTDISGTSAVGSFPSGATPYRCLDMAGNVWEWTRSLWGKDFFNPEFMYPYNPGDGREDLVAPNSMRRVLRGGGFNDNHRYLRCAFRGRGEPYYYNRYVGFRVVVLPYK